MPRKLDRAPRKSSAADEKPEGLCTCKCKSPTDKDGQKAVPEADSSILQSGVRYDIG